MTNGPLRMGRREVSTTNLAATTLASRLAHARKRVFVGREQEQRLWAQALDAEVAPFALLWLTGPGGVGKTALLSRLGEIAATAGRRVVELDARHLDSSPGDFHELVMRHAAPAMMSPAVEDPHGFAALHETSGVLMIDTAEELGLLETWLRDAFLPSLPTTWLVVLAGRTAPDAFWHADAGWRALMRVEVLENLSTAESTAFLQKRGVPEDAHPPLLAATQGHPLALSLVADAVQSGTAGAEVGLEDPDVMTTLLHHFSHNAPDARHRLALHLAAHMRVVNESTLRHALREGDVADLYDWLLSLSFSIVGTEGLYLHDIAAQTLDCDLRKRDPEAYLEMHRRACELLLRQLREQTGLARERAALNYHWLHRYNPVMRPLQDWGSTRLIDSGRLQEADRIQLVEMTRSLLGEETAGAMAFWAERQPQAFMIVREKTGTVRGYVCTVVLTEEETKDPNVLRADPRLSPLLSHMETYAPLRTGERLGIQCWLHYGDQDDVSRMLAPLAIAFNAVWLGRPGVAWSYSVRPQPWGMWANIARYSEFYPGPVFSIADRSFEAHWHDWRAMPPQVHFEVLAKRAVAGEDEILATPLPEPFLVLSRQQFVQAVRAALRACGNAGQLADNPLMRCRVLYDAPSDGAEPSLQAVLGLALAQLEKSAKDEHLHSAVQLTYFDPGKTQEQTAELLGVPFATFRRHLTTGVERMTEWLWQRELNGY